MSCIISYLAFDKCGSSMKRKVHWDDEENGESEMDPFEEASETDVSDDEHSNDEEPRIKDVLGNLSKTVSRKRASDPLHNKSDRPFAPAVQARTLIHSLRQSLQIQKISKVAFRTL